MTKPDLVLFFKFYSGANKEDPRREMVKARKMIYLDLEKQLCSIWQDYIKDKEIEFNQIEPRKDFYEKISKAQGLIREKPYRQIVFTGASHSGKTECIKRLRDI